MRYSASRKAETREHLLQAGGALAKQKGFSATGVDAYMDAAGLTSGAFYHHFSSKADLFSALVAKELEHSFSLFADDSHDADANDWVLHQLKRYLNWKHVQSPQDGCAVPSLGAEIARSDKATKLTYEEAMKRIHQVWATKLGDDKLAWAAMAQLIGAVLMARAMANDKTGKDVLEASKSFLAETLATLDAKP